MRVLNFAFTLTPNLKCLFKTHSLSNKHSWWKIRPLGNNSKWIPYKFHRSQLWPWQFDLEMWFSVTAHPLPTSTSCGKVYYMGENKWLGQGFWIYIYVFDLDLLLQKLGSRSLQPLTKTHSVDVSLIATKKEKICSWTSKWSWGDRMHDHCGPSALRDPN